MACRSLLDMKNDRDSTQALPDQIIAAEKSFSLEIPDLASDAPLNPRGRIDLIEIRDGALWIVPGGGPERRLARSRRAVTTGW